MRERERGRERMTNRAQKRVRERGERGRQTQTDRQTGKREIEEVEALAVGWVLRFSSVILSPL